ncbi:hypothetical protein K5Y32_18910 [Pantoea sp. DY-15]|uniref:hypothetical protein n=1 Tax=unclassified Pantoea TaxID=2630326 RepID=UPI001C9529D7|nr:MULTISPECIES: hypothetical protein [unclassified Pantoea]MBY4838422.1 hypothetical protein [Pantoea sp. DY-5]MBY4890016.1 hypothetical protein [Pantoea sp. DY-15]
MKWRLATLSLASVTLLLLATASLRGWLPSFSHQVFDADFTGNDVEMGIYDVENGQQEFYLPFFAVKSESVMMTLSSKAADSQFIARILLNPQAETRIGMIYSYQPLVVHSIKDKPLLRSIFNFNAHNGVSFNSVEFEGNRILVMPSGLLINQQH